MKKALQIAALLFASLSIFFQYKTISFASAIPDRVREFGRVLMKGGESEKVTDFFFLQAEEIHTAAQDSFMTQQISLGLLTLAVFCLALSLILDKKPSEASE